MKNLRILLADDSRVAMSAMVTCLERIADATRRKIEILAKAGSGDELVRLYSGLFSAGVDYVFTDIRMPVLDGLSALVKIRAIYPKQVVALVSSEDVQEMQIFNRVRGATENAGLDWPKKIELLKRVEYRLIHNIQEAGKINSMLEGCEKLAADPVEVGRELGAAAFLPKPFQEKTVAALLNHLDSGAPFAAIK